MARVQHVAKAQQRYERVPKLDDAGEPIVLPVRNKDGIQKTTKRGRPVTRAVTVADKSKPLPPEKCDFTGCDIDGGEILPGTPYQFLEVKTGPSSTRRYTRHEQHRAWHVWEYSSSLSARLSEIAHDFWEEISNVTDTDEVQSALDSASESIKGLAEEKAEAASNIEDGFGQPTSQSEELAEIAESLESWAGEVEGADIPELPEPDECDDEWHETDEDDKDVEDHCPTCDSENRDERNLLDEPTEGQLDDWRSELADSLTIVDESPV